MSTVASKANRSRQGTPEPAEALSEALPSAAERRERKRGDPAWEVAHLFPVQGDWDECDYLALDSNHLVELDNGFLEVLPMPTKAHQLMVGLFYRWLFAFVAAGDLGQVFTAPFRVRVRRNKFREPDVVFVAREHEDPTVEKYSEGADLVMEVVSDDAESRKRDLKKKPRDYARARIPEYWIVDPQEETVTVLKLSRGKYAKHGTFKRGQTATSKLLPGFEVEVSAVLDAK